MCVIVVLFIYSKYIYECLYIYMNEWIYFHYNVCFGFYVLYVYEYIILRIEIEFLLVAFQ